MWSFNYPCKDGSKKIGRAIPSARPAFSTNQTLLILFFFLFLGLFLLSGSFLGRAVGGGAWYPALVAKACRGTGALGQLVSRYLNKLPERYHGNPFLTGFHLHARHFVHD